MSGLQTKVVAISLIVILAAVNFLGVKKGAFVMNLLTSIKFVGLIGVCVVVFLFAKGSSGNFFSSESAATAGGGVLGSFGIALVSDLWAYKGWETSNSFSGQTKRRQ